MLRARTCGVPEGGSGPEGLAAALEGFSHDAVIGSFLFTFFCDFAFSSPARIGSARARPLSRPASTSAVAHLEPTHVSSLTSARE